MAARRVMGGGSQQHTSSGTGHADRPWVFFMVDCFFLITEFFILTFKFKQEESILPQRLPPGGTAMPSKIIPRDAKEPLRIHVSASAGGGGVVYDVMNTKIPLSDLSAKLAALVSSAGPDRYTVRVSYETSAQWGDVMAVFNACNKVKISECGLVPLRGPDAAPTTARPSVDK